MGSTGYSGSHDARRYLVGRWQPSTSLLPLPPLSSLPWSSYDGLNFTHPFGSNVTSVPESTIPVLRNVVTGEDWLPLHCTRDRFVMLEQVHPAGFVALAHVHPRSAETVVVTRGVIALATGAGSAVAHLQVGDVAHIPPGVSHALWAVDADPTADMIVSYRHEQRDYVRMCEFFEVLSALAGDGLLVWPGIMDPLRASLIWRRFPDLGGFWWLPRWLQEAAVTTLAPCADWLGIRLPATPHSDGRT